MFFFFYKSQSMSTYKISKLSQFQFNFKSFIKCSIWSCLWKWTWYRSSIYWAIVYWYTWTYYVMYYWYLSTYNWFMTPRKTLQNFNNNWKALHQIFDLSANGWTVKSISMLRAFLCFELFYSTIYNTACMFQRLSQIISNHNLQITTNQTTKAKYWMTRLITE